MGQVEYKREIYAWSVRSIINNVEFIQDGSLIKSTIILSADDEKFVSCKIEVVHWDYRLSSCCFSCN